MPEELKPVNLPSRTRNIVSLDNSGPGQLPASISYRQSQDTLESLFASVPVNTGAKQSTRYQAEVDDLLTGRYNNVIYGANNEDIHGRNQSALDKAVNGTLKGVSLAATTFVGGLGTIYGVGKSFYTGKLSDIWENEISESLDKINKEVDNKYLPNYYTDKETNAAWYSSDNLLTTNFLFDKLIKNAGFAVGAIYSGNLAAKGIGIVGKGLGGMFDKVGKYTEAWKTFSDINKGASRLFSQGKNIEAAEVLKKGISSISDVEKASAEMLRLSKQFTNIEGVQDFTRKSIMSLYSSAGESSFEAIGTASAFRENKIQEFRDKWGFDPGKEEMDKINALSKQVGNASFMANMAVLSVTEFTQLPYLMGSSYKTGKATSNAFKTADDVILKESKYVAKPVTKFSKASRFVKSYIFDPKESLQEFLQTSIDLGVQDYYNKAYRGEEAKSLTEAFIDAGSSAFTAIQESLTSKEGGESILLGGLSGGLMQARGKFKEGKVIKTNTNSFLSELNVPENTFINAFNDRVDSLQRGITLQQESEQLLEEGDKSGFLDNKHDQTYNYISTRVKYGRLDMVLDDLNERRKQASTVDGYKNLQATGGAPKDLSREDYTKKLNEFETHAKDVNSLYESMNLRYQGKSDDKGKRVYSDEVIDKMVYAASKINDYDNRLIEISNIVSKSGVNTLSINEALKQSAAWQEGDLENAVREEGVVSSITKAVSDINDLEVSDDDKQELKQVFSDYIDVSLRRKSTLEELNDITKSPKKYSKEIAPKISTQPIKEGEVVQTIKITTKDGEKEVTVGEEYFIGQGVDYDKDGLEVPIKMSRFTILQENEDGTIKILTSRGEEKDVSKDVLAEYKPEKVSTLASNKTANYFYTHRDDIFEYNFGEKYGGKKPGRLEYKDGKLYFVYKNDKGKIARKKIDNSHFLAQEGYVNPRIQKVGGVTSETEEQRIAREEFTSAEEIQKQKETLAKNRDTRLEIIAELQQTAKEELEKVNQKLLSKTEQLQKIQEELDGLQEVKAAEARTKREKKLEEKYPELSRQKVRLSNILSSTSKAVTRLASLKQSVENEVASLTGQKEELELNLSYFEDFTQNLDELPENSGEFLRELKEQVGWLEELIKDTASNLSSLGRLSDSIDKTIKEFVKFLKDSIGAFDSKYPQYLKDGFDRIIASGTIVAEIPQIKEYIADYTLLEDTKQEITLNEDRIEKIREQMDDLQNQMKEIAGEYGAKKALLDRFQKIADEYTAKKEEEEEIFNNKELIAKAVGTVDGGVQTASFTKEYEPDSKKSNELIARATSPASGKPHHIRANFFGVKLNLFPNRNNIRGVYVTSKNEALLIPGLTDHLRTSEDGVIDETINKDQIIALVMVEVSEDGKTMTLVDQNGQPLPEGADKINTAIYQVYPEAKLEWDAKWSKSGKAESMFRDNTPGAQEVNNKIREQYAAWRTKVLANEALEVHEIDASFGKPQYVRDAEGNVVTTTRTSAEDAGLIDTEQLETLPLVIVGKTNDAETSGTVTFKNPLGKVFLQISNGLAKLQNRNLTSKEADNVFNAILQLSKNLLTKKGVESDESVRLLNWLRSIVYWGIPTDQQGNRKPAGYNSVFWEQDPDTGRLMLSISGKGMNFPFTPSSLEENREQITDILKALFNNINSSKIAKINEPYEEILSISSAGEVSSRMWPNYQSYLLSNTTPDGKKRNSQELPLATQYKPVTNAEDVNRDGVYFYTSDTADDFVIPVKTKVIAGPIRTLTPGAPTAQPVAAATVTTPVAPVKYNLNNSPEIFTAPSGKKIRFAATSNASITNLDDIKILSGEDVQDVIDLMKSQGKDPKVEIQKVIFNAISPTIDAMKAAEVNEMEFVIGEDSEVVAEVESITGEPVSNDLLKDVNDAINDLDDEAMREIVENEMDRFEGENWTKLEKWLKENFPNVPVYRVKNVIKATNGAQAWGMYKNGALYIYENAEIGTAYHEVFHAVWRMFTDTAERANIINEFQQRKGSYTERETGKVINYSEATERQIEEKLAEEFRDYVQEGKIPAKPTQGRPYIVKMFADLVNFIKEFFTGNKAQVNTANLFNKIGTGYYKTHSPITSSLSFAKKGVINVEDAFADVNSVFSLVGITDKERSDIIQHMTYLTITDLIKTDKSLFSIPSLSKTEVYTKLKSQVIATLSLKIAAAEGLKGKRTQQEINSVVVPALAFIQNVESQWDQIVARHEEYLKGYQIEFDENDQMNVRADENTGKGEYDGAHKIDNFKKSNTAIKLLMASLPLVDEDNKLIRSPIGGAILLPVSRTYVSLLNNLHSANSVEEMMDVLRKMADADPNYRNLYKRVTKAKDFTTPVDLSKVNTDYGLELLGSFWKTFKKQNPEVVNVFIFENGEVAVGDANLSSAANQLRTEFINNIVIAAKGGKSYFKFDEIQKVFVGDSASLKDVRLETPKDMVDFLGKMGISFTTKELNKLSKKQFGQFKTAVSFIKKGIADGKRVATFSGKSLDMSNRLLELAIVKAAIENPEFDSTFFNISGERTQSYIGTNAAYDLYNFLSQLDKFDKDSLAGTQYEYLLTDSFAKGSNLLKRMFTSKGTRKEGGEELLRTGYVGGTTNEQNGKSKESSRLNYKERLVQELNLNLSGYYLNLIPGDASLEWMMNMGNAISADSLASGFGQINDIFKEYFLSELELAREKGRPVAAGRNANEMRFFKDILGEETHSAIMKDQASLDEVYARFENKINAAVKKFIDTKTQEFQRTLESYGIVKDDMGKINVENVNLPKNMSVADFNRNLTALTVNFMISNIELHKLLYSDPYQYSDELKRIKNFNSPRQALIANSPKMDAAFSTVYNKGFKKEDAGWTNFTRGSFRSVVHKDTIGVIDLPGYEDFKETDGGGIITMKGNRHFRIRANNWNENEEKQYQHDVAYEKLVRSGASVEEITRFERNNPGVKSAYTPLKPIVSGNKADGQKFNDIVLDKFALYPLSFRIMHQLNPESNALKLYDKMQGEDIDYMVFESGRKVGVVNPHDTYINGEFNNAPYTKDNITNIPFSIMGVQSDVPSKDTALVTRGSQVTKLITMDFMEAGVPTDFFPGKDFPTRFKAWDRLTLEQRLERSDIYKEIKDNQDLLEALMTEGYESMLKRLGISESKDKDGNYEYKISNLSEAVKTLRDEILKREVNDNISDALQGFLDGHAVLESTPAYQQIRNILYSIADKEVVSPKISGGMKVQIPSTLLESVRDEEKTINGKTGYTSDYLKFGKEDGKMVCEIMVGRWFKSDMSDKDLLEYLNDTPEGQKILSGLAFRIPTQKQNSIDAFRIKQFLPAEFGDSVVIPAALVNKAGSDFDIDKLNVYFKNVYEDAKGKIKLIPFLGYGKEAKAKFTEMFDKGEFLTKEQLQKVDEIIEKEKNAITSDASGKLMFEIFKDSFDQSIIEDFVLSTTKKEFKEKFIDQMYKKSLENKYIQSTENLVKNERNYDRLIKPNSAEQLKELGKFIAKKTVGGTFNYSDVGNMLDRNYMSRLRHAFVTGKYAIGIAAVNQTNHSLNQRQPIYVDYRRLENLDPTDQFWLTQDPRIKFDRFNSIEIDGQMFPTLSMIGNAEKNEEFPNGQDISDIIGQFIDGYVDISKGPWIMELGATPNVASTWLFLAKIGVPIDTVAYFMNQPIIRDYLRNIESAGYSYLFIDQFVEDVKGMYESQMSVEDAKEYQKTFKIPSKDKLKNLVGKNVDEMNEFEKVDQQAMLTEFLKYAKMAEHMFTVTQGSNFDTATFNDPYLIFKKQQQLIKAQNTIISNVNDLLENSFVGQLGSTVQRVRNALAEIIKSDQKAVRGVIQQVLMPYINMSDRDFTKLAQKAVNDMFDWAVQTNENLAADIKDIMMDDSGVMKEVMEFVRDVKSKPSHPLHNNHVIDIIEAIPSRKLSKNSVNNLKIKGVDNRVYDQNNIIYAFRELREYLNGRSDLYDRLKLLAVLQSGLSNSPISFTSLLPYEDFKDLYNKTLVKLETIPNLADFHNLGVFQRNNWNNDDVVPYKIAPWIKAKKSGKLHYNPGMKFLSENVKMAVASNEIPPVISISQRNREANSDYMVYTWEKGQELLTAEEQKLGTGEQINLIKAKKNSMRKDGDYSYINKALFQKVKDDNGDPLVTPDFEGKPYFVYKAINAWGDSYRANEFYNVDTKSQIDNGFMKVEDVNNNIIINKFLSEKKAKFAEKVSIFENEDLIKERIAELEEKMKTTGIGPTENNLLQQLQTQLGKLIKSKC